MNKKVIIGIVAVITIIVVAAGTIVMTNSNKSNDNNTTENVLSVEKEKTNKTNVVEDADNTTILMNITQYLLAIQFGGAIYHKSFIHF